MIVNAVEGMGFISLKPDLAKIKFSTANQTCEFLYIWLNRFNHLVLVFTGARILGDHVVGIHTFIAAGLITTWIRSQSHDFLHNGLFGFRMGRYGALINW